MLALMLLVAFSAGAEPGAIQRPSFRLTVTKQGRGDIVSDPAGIACGTDCAHFYRVGSLVRLSAIPARGFRFSGWTGPCSATASCTVAITSRVAVGARFEQERPIPVAVRRSGHGRGTVISTPAGIACGHPCMHTFSTGSTVTLIARPSPGSTFVGWRGACAGTAPCTVSKAGRATVTAVFATRPPPAIHPDRDENRTVSATVSADVGSVLTVVADDGSRITLSVPAGAVVWPQEIAMTPLRLGTVSPLSGRWLGGVDLAPGGLRLLRPATLTLERLDAPAADRVSGYGYDGAGEGFHLAPIMATGSRLTLDVTHFSGHGATMATSEDCALTVGSPASAEASARQAIQCVFLAAGNDIDNLSEEQLDAVTEILQAWYDDGVSPSLQGVSDLASAHLAAGEFLAWLHVVELLEPLIGTGALQDAEDAGWALLAKALRALDRSIDARCVASTQLDQKQALTNDLIAIQRIVDVIGVDPVGNLAWTYDSLCDGVLSGRLTLSVTPPRLVLPPAAFVALTVLLRHGATAVTGSLVWESSDPSVATVDQTGIVATRRRGTATITVRATAFGQSLSAQTIVTVESPGLVTIRVTGDGIVGTSPSSLVSCYQRSVTPDCRPAPASSTSPSGRRSRSSPGRRRSPTFPDGAARVKAQPRRRASSRSTARRRCPRTSCRPRASTTLRRSCAPSKSAPRPPARRRGGDGRSRISRACPAPTTASRSCTCRDPAS